MNAGSAAALLAPRSITVVGASDDVTKTASRPLRFLRKGGFAGMVYPVARRTMVMGEQAWPSLDALPWRRSATALRSVPLPLRPPRGASP